MRLFKLIPFVVIILFIVSCSSSYTAMYFSYPPTSSPHEGNWRMLGVIKVEHPHTSHSSEYIERTLRVRIIDNNENKLLEKKLSIKSAELLHEVYWQSSDRLRNQLLDRNTRELIKELSFLKVDDQFIDVNSI